MSEREKVKEAKERLKNRDAMKEKLTQISEEATFKYKSKCFKTQKIVFVPEPKQKWHYELVALIPKIGHEFDCPKEFIWFPYAKYEWLRIMAIDPDHKIITPIKREGFYGYCLMVERLRRCMLEWSGVDIIRESKDKITSDYLASEIHRLSESIAKAAMNLGLLNKDFKEAGKETGGVGKGTESEGKREDGRDGRDDGSDLFD